MSTAANTIPPGLSEPPLVSVCIPVYNGVRFVAETIRSVVAQGCPRMEIIVQDNASTDGTWQLLGELAGSYPQLSIARNECNVGMTPNWNRAVNRARGDYVMLLSADDLLEPGFLDACLTVFAREQVDVVTTNHFWMRDGEKKQRKMKVEPGIHQDFSSMILLKNPFSVNFSLFSRSSVEQMRVRGNLFAVNYFSCDYDLWLRFALAGKRIHYLDEPLGTYRVHADNLSRHTMRMHRQAALVVLRHRRELARAAGSAYRLTLIRFLYRILSCMVRLHLFDGRQFRLLWGRLRESVAAS